MMNELYKSIVSMQALKCKGRDAAAVGMFMIESSMRIGTAMTFVFYRRHAGVDFLRAISG